MGIGLIVIGVILWFVNFVGVNVYIKNPTTRIWGILPGALIAGFIVGYGINFL